MGRINFLFLFLSLFFLVSPLIAQSTVDQDILQELTDFRADWAYVMERDAGTISELFSEILYGPGGFGGGADGVGIIGLNLKLEQLSEYLQTSLVEQLDQLIAIYDVLSTQGGTKDDWQTLQISLSDVQNSLYNLSKIQTDTSTIASDVSLLNQEISSISETLSLKLSQIQDSNNYNLNNLLDSLGAKLDSVVNSIDQFRYFDFSITADVDFQPVIEYLKDISDNGVKINGFDGDIFITNSVDLSEIIYNQQKQITNQEEQLEYSLGNLQYWERLEYFLGIPNYTLDEYFYAITHGNTNDWKQASLKGVTYYLWEIRKVLDSITNSVTNLRQDSELSSITENARNYINAGDYVVSNFSEISDTSYSYLTNVNKKAEIIPIEYDFTPYTNVTDVINNIKDEYYYMQMMSNTNQFVSASTSVTEALNKQVESMTPLFERNYNSTIKINWDLLGVNKEIDLARYVTFDSDKFKTCWDFVIWISTILFGLKALKNIWEN